MQQGGLAGGGASGGSLAPPRQHGRKRSASSLPATAAWGPGGLEVGGGGASPGQAAGGEGAAKRLCNNEALDAEGRPYRYIVKVRGGTVSGGLIQSRANFNLSATQARDSVSSNLCELPVPTSVAFRLAASGVPRSGAPRKVSRGSTTAPTCATPGSRPRMQTCECSMNDDDTEDMRGSEDATPHSQRAGLEHSRPRGSISAPDMCLHVTNG